MFVLDTSYIVTDGVRKQSATRWQYQTGDRQGSLAQLVTTTAKDTRGIMPSYEMCVLWIIIFKGTSSAPEEYYKCLTCNKIIIIFKQLHSPVYENG